MKSETHNPHSVRSRFLSKRFILTTSTVLCIGLSAFTYQKNTSSKKIHPVPSQKNNQERSISYQSSHNHTSNHDLKEQLAGLVSSTFGHQELSYEIHGMYKRPIKKEILENAKTLGDLISEYPANWITGYQSVEISAMHHGKVLTALGTNDLLTLEQKSILQSAELATELEIKVKYHHKDAVTKKVEHNTMLVSMTIVPETEAEYMGGIQHLISYLKSNHAIQFPETNPKKPQYVGILFTVNEEGLISSAKLSHSSGDLKTDDSAIECVYKMPKWKPAVTAKGIKVKQQFELRIGNGMNDGC